MNHNIKTAAFAVLVALGGVSGCSAMQKQIDAVVTTKAQMLINIGLHGAPAEQKMVAVATDKETGEVKEIFCSGFEITFKKDLVKASDSNSGLIVTFDKTGTVVDVAKRFIRKKRKQIITPATLCSLENFLDPQESPVQPQKALVQTRTIAQDMQKMQTLHKVLKNIVGPVVKNILSRKTIIEISDQPDKFVNVEALEQSLGITVQQLPNGVAVVRCEQYRLLITYQYGAIKSVKENFKDECILRLGEYGRSAH